MKKSSFKNKKFYQFFFVFLIFVISVFNLRYFFKPGIFRGHDAENHLARIANYYLAIKDGQIPPRWAKNLNHKFGYPVFNYNYPLANILAQPLIVIGLTIEDSLKVILFLAYFVSGLFFYLWLKNHFSSFAAFVGAVFYLCSPYQFLDLYVRGVVGENLTFALLPAILYFLWLLSEKINKWKFLGLFLLTASFSLSHNIMVLIFTPLIFGYWFYLAKTKKNQDFLKFSLVGLILGFLTTSFFWLPAFLEKGYTTLNAFDPKSFYQDHFVNFRQLIHSPWQYGFSVPGFDDKMPFQIGVFHWLAILLSLIFLITKFKENKKESLLVFSQVIFWLAVFLMLPFSLFFWKLIPFLGYLQFPWRLLALAMFASSLAVVFLVKNQRILGVILAVACFIYSASMTKPFFWEKKSDMYYYDFLFTTSVRHENMPVWFQESNIEHFKTKLTSDSGLVSFKELIWKTGKHVYETNAPETTTIWEHTAYFPGWEAFIDSHPTAIKYDHEIYPGLIGLKIPSGRHQIMVKFTEKTPGAYNWRPC